MEADRAQRMRAAKGMAIAFLGVLLLLAPADKANALLITFQSDDTNAYDAYVMGGSPDSANDYNPSGDDGTYSIEVDGLDGGGEVHGLLRFLNIVGSGPGQIPAGSTINSATLSLWYVNDNADADIEFYRMTSTWNEASTWNSLAGGVMPGTNADATDSITANFGGTDPVSVGLDVTAHVASWVEDGNPNYGWGILDSIVNGWQFTSSEETTGGSPGWHTPRLDVDYTLVPEPSSALLLGLGLVGLAARRRSH